MAEAIAVIGAIAACSQLAKYGTGLTKFMLNSPSELHNLSSTIEELVERLNWHSGIVRSFSTETPSGAPSVEPIVRTSIRAASSLQQLLAPLIVEGKQTRVKRLKRVLSYQKRIRKIDRCRAELESCERQLTLHLAATTYYHIKHDTEYRIEEVRPSLLHSLIGPPSRSSTSTTLQGSTMSFGEVFGLPPRSTFIGRDSTLCSISRLLIEPGHKVCLAGPGGIGKTEVAKECAYRIHGLHPSISIFWLQTSDKVTFDTDLEQLSTNFKAFEGFETQGVTISDLIEKLDQVCNSQWLLIIDDIHTQLLGILGSQKLVSLPTRHGSILLTTRDHETSHLVEDRFIFSLDNMTASEATQMLESRVDISFLTTDGSSELVEYLEYHPAFIARVADFMRSRNISASRYLQLLQKVEQYYSTLLGQMLPMDHHSTPLLTEDIISIVSMDRICTQDKNAASILTTSAFLGQAKIPLTLFETSYNSTQLVHALEVLRASSLVMLNKPDHSITIPRLVRLCVRAYLRRYGMSWLYAYYALRITAQCFPENNKQFSMLQKGRNYLPHALAILEEYEIAFTSNHHLMAIDHTLPPLATHEHSFDAINFHSGTYTGSNAPLDYVGPLAIRVAHFFCVLGQYSRAMQVATLASRWLSTAPAADVLSCEISITSLFLYLGGPAIFASQIEQILLSQTVLLKSHRPLTIRLLRSKALALQGQGHYSQAEGYHRRAIFICKSTYGSKDIRFLDEEHGLALSLLGQKRPQEALNTLCAIYTTMEQQLTLSNPKTLSVLANIGCALQHLSRWTDAYRATSRALSGRKEVLGEDHPHTIQTYANLAQIYVVNGDYAAAESTTRETLRVHVSKLGEDHHLSLHILNNLGYFLLGQERWDEAAETLDRVARKRETVLGIDHCDTLETLFYASEAYWKMKRFDEALELGGKVLRARQILDEDSGERREIEVRLAEIQRDRDIIR